MTLFFLHNLSPEAFSALLAAVITLLFGLVLVLTRTNR